jgi:glutamate--cysteine ligase
MTELAVLRDRIHGESFTPDLSGRRGVGAEVELLAHDAGTHRPLPLLGGRSALIPRLRRYGARNGWTEFAGYDGLARFDAGGKGIISFEPGGQIEFSSAACSAPAALTRLLDAVVPPLVAAMADEGVELLSIGLDPYNSAEDIPLQLPVTRYERMTAHFESIGPFGIRMMRQTAAIQVSVDRGERPAERWRLLNDLAPYLIAIFANSPCYAGEETGHQSFRANCWRRLDPTRTGVAEIDEDPALAYARFALSATDILDAGIDTHLTTLFPEVRPRGHFEVRSCDAIDPRWYAAPVILLTALAYDARAASEAALLAAESRSLLRPAGEQGLRDESIARTARDLCQLALDAASRLGDEYIDGATRDRAAEYFTRYTFRDQSAADDFAYRARMRTVRSRSSRV